MKRIAGGLFGRKRLFDFIAVNAFGRPALCNPGAVFLKLNREIGPHPNNGWATGDFGQVLNIRICLWGFVSGIGEYGQKGLAALAVESLLPEMLRMWRGILTFR